jgi:hypothetical protein
MSEMKKDHKKVWLLISGDNEEGDYLEGVFFSSKEAEHWFSKIYVTAKSEYLKLYQVVDKGNPAENLVLIKIKRGVN